MGLIRKEDIHESLLNSLSNPNLLINGDFQVWQRGEVFTAETNGLMLYTADRWHFWSDNAAYPQRSKVEKYNGHFKFTSVGNDWLRQHIEADLSGVPLTLSISVKGSAESKIILRMDDAKSPTDQSITNVANKAYICTGGYDTFVLNIPAFNYSKFPTVLIRSKSIDVFEIEWVKLEYGSLATPFVPRKYTEELNLCKRYYQIIRFGGHCTHETSFLPCVTNFPVPMRVVPSFELNYIGRGKNKMDCFGSGDMQFDEMTAFLDASHLFHLQDNAPVKQMIIGKYYDSYGVLDAEIY